MTSDDSASKFVIDWIEPNNKWAIDSLKSILLRWDCSGSLQSDREVSFVVRDPMRNIVIAQRDTLGRSPLYRRFAGGESRFASTMEALLGQGDDLQVSPLGIALFLTLQFSPAPSTLIEGITKLAPGEQRIERGGALLWRRFEVPVLFAGWGPQEQNARDVLAGVFARLASDFRTRPVVSLMSGGVDSTSNLVGLTGAGLRPSLRTASFADAEYDEAPAAKATAACFNLVPRIEQIRMQSIHTLTDIAANLIEPICDRALIATRLILTRDEGVEIVTGEGGDELWGAPRRWGRMRFDREASATAVAAEYLALVACSTFDQRVAWLGDTNLSRASEDHLQTLYEELGGRCGARSDYERAKAFQLYGWFAENVQAKDRAAAASVGGNLHLPLISRECREFIGSLSSEEHLLGTRDKGFLRDHISTAIPAAAIDRPKQKFKVPPSVWMSPELIDYVHQFVTGSTGRLSSVLDGRELFRSIKADEVDPRLIWGLFVVGVWLERLQQSRACQAGF